MRLDIGGLKVDFGRKTVLNDISLSVLPGEFVGILGASGCGKSTLLKAAAGVSPVKTGVIHYDGVPFDQLIPGTVAYVPQDDVVHPALSAQSELTYSARLRFPEKSPQEIAYMTDKVIAQIELENVRTVPISKLSGGQRKRVSIGMELLGDPSIIFLDEPTSGLDPALEDQMMKLFRTLAAPPKTVVITTHILQNLFMLDLAAILAAGKLVWYGPACDMLKWFKVNQARDIYSLLLTHGDILAENYAKSSFFQEYVEKRIMDSP